MSDSKAFLVLFYTYTSGLCPFSILRHRVTGMEFRVSRSYIDIVKNLALWSVLPNTGRQD